MLRQLTRGARLLLLTLLPTLMYQVAAAQQDVAKGEQLFKANCTSCHAVGKKVIGPALAKVYERRDEQWIINFVHNSTAVIKSGDEYAVKLYAEYNQTLMTAFPQIADDDVRNIIAYIKQESEKAPAPGPGLATAPGGAAPVDQTLYYSLVGLAGLLVVVALAMLVIIALLINALKAKEAKEKGEAAPSVWSTFKGIATNKFVTTSITLLIVAIVCQQTYVQSRKVGLHQGYAPVQPVAFSHKIHAGQYGINCNYCHVGVEKGKSATIPGVNVCMNCHNYIEEGTLTGKGEIAKVRDAWDKKQTIEWVRIHNLPDLVYFNHSQHVKVAGVQCQSCHGPIETMDVVYQYNDLSMGWCINCHRSTETGRVDVSKSEYYLKVHDEYVQKVKDGKAQGKEVVITAADLGALECAKCHY